MPLPPGYDFDGCDRETLLHRLSVKDGRLVLPSGMSYRYLMLSDDRTMTPELARRVRELVEAGATVIGPKPVRSPSLHGFPQCDEEVRAIADALWGSGRVICGKTFDEIAQADGLPPDFAFTSTSSDVNVRYIHRRSADADLYFVANGPIKPSTWSPNSVSPANAPNSGIPKRAGSHCLRCSTRSTAAPRSPCTSTVCSPCSSSSARPGRSGGSFAWSLAPPARVRPRRSS